jgi:2-polyprenyl-6-methoxyphenol hydroxylase-like FAD-dependent oxidoreductase
MPQWDFLNFLADEARRFPEFTVLMQAEAIDLVHSEGLVTGLSATTPTGEIEVAARLVVGADGRHSTVRERAGLVVEDLGAPMDVLWMRLPRQPDDPPAALGNIVAGRIFVMIPRGDYFQCGYVVAKGSFDEIRRQGLEALQASIVEISPLMKDRVAVLADWDQVKLLTVAVDRLQRWAAPGLLCIGDAAHAMSPIGGVGINLAIQDAVAAANILAPVLRDRAPSLADLEAVQARREPPTRFMQGLQLTLQRAVIAPTLAGAGAAPSVPWPARLLNRVPLLRRIPARVLGLGTRFESVRSPNVHAGGARPAG